MKTTLAEKEEATPIRLRRGPDGGLCLLADGKNVRVRAQLCFPWSAPDAFISLRDDDGNELAFLENLETLDAPSRTALQQAMEVAGFVLEITGVNSIRLDFELRVWDVETRQGPRKFQTKLEDWPTPSPGGGLVIHDVAGDIYRITDPNALDPKSRELLWAYAG